MSSLKAQLGGPMYFYIYTVKRPKFDTLFGENIFFLQNLFRWPPLKVFGGVSKIRIYQLIKVCYSIWTRQGPQNYTFLQVSNLRLQCLTSSCERIISDLGLFIDSECVPPLNQRGGNTRLQVRGRGEPILTTGEKAWHSVYSVVVPRRLFFTALQWILHLVYISNIFMKTKG